MAEAPARPTMRLDKWLWQARFFKTRSLAARVVGDGKVRVNAEPAAKPARAVGEGDVLTFVQARRVRVVRIAGLGHRRGPPAEASALYDDLSPPAAESQERAGPRPTKKDRRATEALRRPPLE